MTDPSSLATAELRATEARERLMGTVGSLQSRLDPRSMARDAVDGITDSGSRAIGAAVAAVQRNPGKLVGAAAVAALFVARHRIVALFRKPDKAAKPEPTPRVRRIRNRPSRRDEEAS